jgi:primosomal protein N' (replication factor Y)
VGAGTERIEDGLRLLFPDTHLIRVDRDTTQKKHSFKEKLAAIQQGEPLLLLGTQMLAKGHHFPNVTLVAIINADSGFLSSDFRGPERMSQLIIQVAGRAGRAEKPGHVILQSHQPDNPALQKLLREGYQGLSEEILRERIDAELPPFTHAALFRAEAHHSEHCHIFLEEVAELVRKHSLDQDQIEILGPVPAPMEKRAGRYRTQLLLQSKTRPPLHQLIQQNMPLIDELKTGRKVRWSLDVDPADFT